MRQPFAKLYGDFVYRAVDLKAEVTGKRARRIAVVTGVIDGRRMVIAEDPSSLGCFTSIPEAAKAAGELLQHLRALRRAARTTQ